jgi:hypothetical protein
MDNHTVYVNTVYYDSNNDYRPFLTANAHEKWPTNKIAFFCSTGKSAIYNTFEVNYRKNTWIPNLGITEKGTILHSINDKKIYPENWIITSVPVSIFKMHYKWYHAILKHIEYSPIDKKPEWSILQYLKKEIIDDNIIYLLMDHVRKCIIVLGNYCSFWWQVQISAQLGGGLWGIVPIFRRYVLSYDFDDYGKKNRFIIRDKCLDELKIVYNVPEKNNNTVKEVNADLKSQGALIELFVLQDYRPYVKQLKRIFNYGAKSKTQILELKKTVKHKMKQKITKSNKNKKQTRKRV